MFGCDNAVPRETWLKKTLGEILRGLCLLDAGAGELHNKGFCSYLNYVSRDFRRLVK